MHFEVHASCTHCRVEGALLETWDTETATGRLGLPLSARCRLCGRATEARANADRVTPSGCPVCGADLDERAQEAHACPTCGAHAVSTETTPGRIFASLAELEVSLTTWAREEGLRTAKELLESSFVVGSLEGLHQALARGELVETTFDVTDLLFGSGAAGGEGIAVAEVEEKAPDTVRTSLPPSIRRWGDARDELLALASIAAADGQANQGDLMALEQAARTRGIPPLQLADVYVRRPAEVAPPPTLVDRERVLEEMFRMAWADGEMDESELKVIRDFARVWGIDPERLASWVKQYTFAETGPVERWFRRIGQMIFPER